MAIIGGWEEQSFVFVVSPSERRTCSCVKNAKNSTIRSSTTAT